MFKTEQVEHTKILSPLAIIMCHTSFAKPQMQQRNMFKTKQVKHTEL